MIPTMKSNVILFLSLLLITACQTKEIQTVAVEPETKEEIKAEETKQEVVLMPCTKEAKQCTNGKVVGRNPSNNCEFDSCEIKLPKSKKNAVMCTADVNECPDGSYVGRDHYNNCKFKDCPHSEQ